MKLEKNSNGFSPIEVLLASLILVVIIACGFLVYQLRQNPAKAAGITVGTYTYSNYKFPYMPAGFVLQNKQTPKNQFPEANYTSSLTLDKIEVDVTDICKYNDYSLNGDVNVYNKTSNGKPATTDYSIQCKDNTNTWLFDITAANANYWDMTVSQAGPLTCTGSGNDTGGETCGPPSCKTITIDGDSACK
ncbi:MAG TPA: hypothetical protein VMR34_05765 [Candidatus Saccharimonadales bacterium]|nr:hypothetical protein [Candidatus Saccharimonadales bacterium]